MQQQIIKFEKKLDRLSKRDQIALFISFLVVVLMIWSKLIYAPLSDNMMVIEQDIAQNKTEIEVLQAKMLALQKSINADPDTENRQQLDKYLEENSRLDAALASTSIQIINPQEMTSLLEQLLKSQAGLKFVSLKNKPAAAEFVESHGETESAVENVNTIYRHSVVLQMEGSYHDTLSYLKKLEQLPWRFFWQSVEIEASGYPNALITLEVYTLGFREGLVGV
jgi:MSHA biogenesis protein MshJ